MTATQPTDVSDQKPDFDYMYKNPLKLDKDEMMIKNGSSKLKYFSSQTQYMKDGDNYRKLQTVQKNNTITQTSSYGNMKLEKKIWDFNNPNISDAVKFNGNPDELINEFSQN